MQFFRVSIPPAVKSSLLRQMDMRSLMCAQIWECRTYEGGSGTNKSAQESTQRDRKTVFHLAPPGDRTRFSDLNSDSLTTELHLPSGVE